MITSHDNPKLKEARKLADRRWRDRTGRFLAEGEDLVAAAEEAGWGPAWTLRAGVDVDAPLLDGVSSLGSGTRVMAAYEQRWAPEATAPCVALWGVHDPGNVGTVLRSALAFGAASVALGPDCADPYGPKAVRGSMGAIFAVPLVRVESAGELPAPRVALVARQGVELETVEAAGTLLVGGERQGIPDAVVQECEAVAHIPIGSESLNAAMAATVGLYRLSRIARHA